MMFDLSIIKNGIFSLSIQQHTVHVVKVVSIVFINVCSNLIQMIVP